MGNSRETSFSCNCSPDSPKRFHRTQELVLPAEAQKLQEPGWSGPWPRGPQHSETGCMCGWYQDDLGFM